MKLPSPAWTKRQQSSRRFRPTLESLEYRDCPSTGLRNFDMTGLFTTPAIASGTNAGQSTTRSAPVDTSATALYNLNQQYNFYLDGTYQQNWSQSLNEKWIRAANSSNQFFYILPDGTLHQWTGTFAGSTLVATVGAAVWDNPALLHDAQPATGPSVSNYDLQQRLGFDYTGSFQQNWSGSLNEKWFRSTQDSNAWYYIVSDGTMYRWNGSFATSTVAAKVDPAAYTNPFLLFNAQPPTVLLNDLNARYGFFFTGNYQQNWSGSLDEKWIRATNDNNSWYYLTPQGNLFRWNGSFASSTFTAFVGSQVWNNPSLLHDAGSVPANSGPSDYLFTLNQRFDFQFTGSFNQNWSGSLNEKWLSSASGASYFLLPNGALYRWSGDFATSPFIAQAGTDVYADPALLYNAQPPTGLLSELNHNYGFTSDGNYQQNWSGSLNEKWIQASKDNNTWYYILPDGSLFRWTGSFATSRFIASVGTSVWNSPSLLYTA